MGVGSGGGSAVHKSGESQSQSEGPRPSRKRRGETGQQLEPGDVAECNGGEAKAAWCVEESAGEWESEMFVIEAKQQPVEGRKPRPAVCCTGNCDCEGREATNPRTSRSDNRPVRLHLTLSRATVYISC